MKSTGGQPKPLDDADRVFIVMIVFFLQIGPFFNLVPDRRLLLSLVICIICEHQLQLCGHVTCHQKVYFAPFVVFTRNNTEWRRPKGVYS